MPLVQPPSDFFQRHDTALVDGFDTAINSGECFFVYFYRFFGRSKLVCGLSFTHILPH